MGHDHNLHEDNPQESHSHEAKVEGKFEVENQETGHLNTADGWCCNGMTWREHSEQNAEKGGSGKCCQPQGTMIEDLPEEGQRLANERLDGEAGKERVEERYGEGY